MNKKTRDLIIKEFENVGFTNYYLQMFDKSRPFEDRVELLLKFVNVDPAKLGYNNIKEVLIYLHKNGYGDIPIPASTIYSYVAEKLCTKAQAIERNIRTAKEESFDSLSPNVKVILFGDLYIFKMPGNMTFIYQLYKFLKSDII
jgi:hypothetical protein